MKFQWVKLGMSDIFQADLADAQLKAAGNELRLVTTDPFTYDWDMTDADLAFATFTGSDPQLMSTLTVIGPFQDSVNEEIYDKIVGVSWTNTGVTTESITGIAFSTHAGGNLWAVIIFDDPVPMPPGTTITLDIPAGIGQGNPDSSIEVLTGV